jgi:hypothetical protein
MSGPSATVRLSMLSMSGNVRMLPLRWLSISVLLLYSCVNL